MVVLLLLVSFITFVIFYLFPSADPAQLRAGRQPNPQLVEQIRHQLNLDKPFYVQYWLYMKQLVLHFDFGRSYQNNIQVRRQIFDRLPATISLTAGAAVVWLLVGISVGTISAVKSRSLIDRVSMGGALVGISAPVYWLGLVALYLFSNDIGLIKIFPGSGSYVPLSQDPTKWFTSLIMPWLVLAAAFAAFYARLLRSNLVEVMGEDYIRTARAKGLTETVFNIPGIGRLAYESIQNSDLPMIQGTVLMGAFFIILANLVVDIGYAVIDPRVRYS
jgi:peptide/nickel transport system permease protein